MVTEWLVVGTFVQECLKSGFKTGAEIIEIIGVCMTMRECIPDTRDSVQNSAVRMQCVVVES